MDTHTPPRTVPREDRSHRRSIFMLAALAVLLVVVPFMFWHDSWFGRKLSDQQIEEYLQDENHPRRIQHALSQIADRIIQRDGDVKKWYPLILAMTEHPNTEIRNTVAWVLGQDNQSEEFHRALVQLLKDPQVMVRRNAALSLVRFGDANGRIELVNILKPYQVRAPGSGTVSTQLEVDQQVGRGMLLAQITLDDTQALELRAPFPARVRRIAVEDGSAVEAGELMILIESGAKQILAALQGLYLVGEEEDLPEIENLTDPEAAASEDIHQQAAYTVRAIRSRSKRKATR